MQIRILNPSLGVLWPGSWKPQLHLGTITYDLTQDPSIDSSFCRPFLSLIISILVSQPLLLNYSHNTCNLNLARSFNPACLFEVGQEAYCTICKFQFTRFNVQGSTYKNSMNKNDLQASEPLQPYFKSRKGISQTSLRRGVLNKICRQFLFLWFAQREKAKKILPTSYVWGNLSTFPQPRILFWFTSSGFCKRPVSLKYWLLCPFFFKETTCKSSTVKGLLYTAKAVSSKDYFMHLTLKNVKKGRWVISPNYCASHPWHYCAVEDVVAQRYDVLWDWLWDACHMAGYVEDPAAKDFVARKARTITLSKAQGSCHKTSNNPPYLRVWKSLGDSIPELYCVASLGLSHARKCQFKDFSE